MKRLASTMEGFTMQGSDGEIGKVLEFYFDDHSWTLRYLIVETGNWFNSHKILISSFALLEPNWEENNFPVSLTQNQILNSPLIDTDLPVSRQEEMKLYNYYPWTNYWDGGVGMGMSGMMDGLEPSVWQILKEKSSKNEPVFNPFLRSSKAVKGYHIRTEDGEIGHVDDFIIDDYTWRIDFIVVDTRNWISGKKVLITPKHIKNINWETSELEILGTQEEVRLSPEYNAGDVLDEKYLEELSYYYSDFSYINEL